MLCGNYNTDLLIIILQISTATFTFNPIFSWHLEDVEIIIGLISEEVFPMSEKKKPGSFHLVRELIMDFYEFCIRATNMFLYLCMSVNVNVDFS